jgi:hypothetical protein
VNLPDVGNGLFLHGAARVVDAHEARELWRIAGRHQADVIVFASDGGGTLYALASPTGSPVFRLPAGQVVGGVYESGDPWFEIVAASLAGSSAGSTTPWSSSPRPAGSLSCEPAWLGHLYSISWD